MPIEHRPLERRRLALDNKEIGPCFSDAARSLDHISIVQDRDQAQQVEGGPAGRSDLPNRRFAFVGSMNLYRA